MAKFYDIATDESKRLDWDRLAKVTHLCTRFLDNVIDTCPWPLPEINDVVKRTRPVGLGIMGFADLCLNLEDHLRLAEFDRFDGRGDGLCSPRGWTGILRLGAEKGVFPELEANREAYANFSTTKSASRVTVPLTPRNYEVTTIAPTGTISLVAETSSGIEPNFSWAYVRKDTLGTRTYVHTLAAQALGMDVDQTDEDSIDAAAEYVVEHEHELPPYFISAMTSAPSSTCTCSPPRRRTSTTRFQDLQRRRRRHGRISRRALSPGAQLGCKAVSYYRDGSREGQVLTSMKPESRPDGRDDLSLASRRFRPRRSDLRLSEPGTQATAVVGLASSVRANSRRDLADSVRRPEPLRHRQSRRQKIQEVFATGPISGGVGMLASKMLRGGFDAPKSPTASTKSPARTPSGSTNAC